MNNPNNILWKKTSVSNLLKNKAKKKTAVKTNRKFSQLNKVIKKCNTINIPRTRWSHELREQGALYNVTIIRGVGSSVNVEQLNERMNMNDSLQRHAQGEMYLSCHIKFV